MLKRLISVASALLLSMTCFSAAVCAEGAEPTRVYRTSVSGDTDTDDNYNISYIATLEAYSNGSIHIEVQTVKASVFFINRILGDFTFNDSIIKSINESKKTDCRSSYSYDENNTIYTISTDYCKSFSYIANLQVQDTYLNTTIPFTFFGKEIEIPFGSEALPTGDAELQNMITKLKAENEELSKKNTELNTKVSELETQNKELDTANKKYQTELENLTTQNQALATSILKFENENAALKAQLAAFDSDADGLLTTADAQMILIYYTEYLAGAVSGTTGDYAAYIKQFKGQ